MPLFVTYIIVAVTDFLLWSPASTTEKRYPNQCVLSATSRNQTTQNFHTVKHNDNLSQPNLTQLFEYCMIFAWNII